MKPAERAVLIAGPTASGKSALAMRIAEERDGVIINTDSMQVYSVLNIFTARPGPEDMKRIPHYLYGHVDPRDLYSTGSWLSDVSDLLKRPELEGRIPVFAGGTGLYFRALLGGLSAMPEIPDRVRQRWRYRLAEEGAAKLHRVLRSADPEAALVLKPGDGQRIVRALEVMDASGQSILHWQKQRGEPLIDPKTCERLVIDPDRDKLGQTIEIRFVDMVQRGALAEVQKLLALEIDPDMPSMKAIGVRELTRVIEGEITIEVAIERAVIATRQYAKRQATWFRNQCDQDWRRLKFDADSQAFVPAADISGR